MSKILILAPSGSGKTSSLRNLPPNVTGIINADKKELPLRAWRTNYVTVRDKDNKIDLSASNFIESNNPSTVSAAIQNWNNNPRIENIVLDTITHMITKDYMDNTIGKDFKAYQKLGKNFYDILQLIAGCKKNVIIFGHIEKNISPTGEVVYDLKSHGKMITDLVPASYFTTVLVGMKRKLPDNKFEYVFRTQSEGDDPAKSPAYFDEHGDVKTALELYEPNDVNLILKKLELFETGIEPGI